jgi:excisionase family DNA binding protein
MTDKQYLKLSEVATLLGVDETTIQRRCRRGEFPYRRWGRTIMISRRELDEFLQTLPGCDVPSAVAACVASWGEDTDAASQT